MLSSLAFDRPVNEERRRVVALDWAEAPPEPRRSEAAVAAAAWAARRRASEPRRPLWYLELEPGGEVTCMRVSGDGASTTPVLRDLREADLTEDIEARGLRMGSDTGGGAVDEGGFSPAASSSCEAFRIASGNVVR